MAEHSISRRRFLKSTAIGLSGAGVLALAPNLVALPSDEAAALLGSEDFKAGSSEPVVAYVRNAAEGEVVLMVGTKEIVRKDRALAARLVRCCQEA